MQKTIQFLFLMPFRILSVILLLSFNCNFLKSQEENNGLVKWLSLKEAQEKNKVLSKPFIIDVYTDWCGWCKHMMKTTYSNPGLANYINTHFYPVKFDAETRDSVKFNGFVFANKNPEGTQRPVHDFAVSILEGKLSYPSVVFLNEDIKKIQTVVGYYQAEQFEPIMKYFGSGKYKDTPWEDYQKTFVTEIKAAEPVDFPGK